MSALYSGVKTMSAAKSAKEDVPSLPPDMSTISLVGGGLIAGDSLAALSVGVYGLLTTVLFK